MPSQESRSVAICPVISGAKFGVVFSALVLIIFLASANLAHGRSSKAAHGTVEEQPFGTTKEGKKITLYTLTNSQHMEIRAMNYGAIIVSLRVPDRKGQVADIVLATTLSTVISTTLRTSAAWSDAMPTGLPTAHSPSMA